VHVSLEANVAYSQIDIFFFFNFPIDLSIKPERIIQPIVNVHLLSCISNL
jgi:hypothetical protein